MGKLANRLGMRRSLILGSLVAGITLAAVPLLPRMLYTWNAPKAVAIASTSVVYCMHTCAMLTAGTGAMGMTSNLCAQHPRRSGALNGAVALTDGIGKMIGPALAAPIFALAISSPPPAGSQALTGADTHGDVQSDAQSTIAQSTIPLAFFCALGALFVALGAAGALLPSSVDGVNPKSSSTSTSRSQAFSRLQEES